MNILARLLSVLVFALTCFVGGALLLVALTVAHHPQAKTPSYRSVPAEPEAKPAFSIILSRLPLLPSFSRGKQLVTVMIENHEAARPHQKGLSDALLIEEFFVEGYISRFAALYDVKHLPNILGPVRSLRPYFIDGMLPWSHIFIHAGGSPEALGRFATDPTITSLNGLHFYDHFQRDESVPAPHNLFLAADRALDLLSSDLPSIAWPPYPVGNASGGNEASVISINFFNPENNVTYTFDSGLGRYIRKNGDIVSEAEPSNVLLLQIPVLGEGESGRLDIDVVGKGKAVLFRSGVAIEGRWRKDAVSKPFVFEDLSGQLLPFSRGQTWITVVDSLEGRVKWK